MSSPIAHGAVALLTKRFKPDIPLWLLLLATQIPDIFYFLFYGIGLEIQAVTRQDLQNGIQYISPPFIPWSHGLFMCLVWSVLVTLITWLFLKKWLNSLIVGGMVLTHWLLDALVYSNLPLLFDNSIQLGFGIATSGIGFIFGILIEIGLIGSGLIFYILFLQKKIKNNKNHVGDTQR